VPCRGRARQLVVRGERPLPGVEIGGLERDVAPPAELVDEQVPLLLGVRLEHRRPLAPADHALADALRDALEGRVEHGVADVLEHELAVGRRRRVRALVLGEAVDPAVSQVALSSAPAEQSGLAAGVNDMFRQAGIAIGVAALGALIPAGAAFGDGSPQSYVDGMRDALWLGALLSVSAAAAAALLIRGRRQEDADVPREVALEAA
jgi:hypothetical protein